MKRSYSTDGIIKFLCCIVVGGSLALGNYISSATAALTLVLMIVEKDKSE